MMEMCFSCDCTDKLLPVVIPKRSCVDAQTYGLRRMKTNDFWSFEVLVNLRNVHVLKEGHNYVNFLRAYLLLVGFVLS
jgi:hypothetical protein